MDGSGTYSDYCGPSQTFLWYLPYLPYLLMSTRAPVAVEPEPLLGSTAERALCTARKAFE